MSNATDSFCAQFEADDTAARYVSGRLRAVEAEAFERHLIGCADCQREVRLGGVVRAELRTTPRSTTRRTGRRGVAWASLGLAAALGLFSLARLGSGWELRALSAVATMPTYDGVAVRASPLSADSLFVEGMRLYASRRYTESRGMLAAARTQGADSIPSSFFIGVMHLAAGDARSALSDLAIVIRRGDSPYVPEAHYYAAKAWLRLGRADSAIVSLERAEAASPGMSAARSLADSIIATRGTRR